MLQKGHYMPPKAKFTGDEIIEAGLEILREKGPSAVTARELGNRLNCSPRPIFTVFESMTEVMEGIEAKARDIYTSYIKNGLSEDKAFRGVGIAYITFAMKEPRLFELLFMRKVPGNIGVEGILPVIDVNYEDILTSITSDYPVTRDEADVIYRHLWIYSHGIATLLATSMCSFTPEKIGEMLTDVFKSLLKERLAGKK